MVADVFAAPTCHSHKEGPKANDAGPGALPERSRTYEIARMHTNGPSTERLVRARAIGRHDGVTALGVWRALLDRSPRRGP